MGLRMRLANFDFRIFTHRLEIFYFTSLTFILFNTRVRETVATKRTKIKEFLRSLSTSNFQECVLINLTALSDFYYLLEGNVLAISIFIRLATLDNHFKLYRLPRLVSTNLILTTGS